LSKSGQLSKIDGEGGSVGNPLLPDAWKYILHVMKNDSALTAAKAVLRGHVVITLPVLAIIGLITTLAYFLIGSSSEHEARFAVLMLHAERVPIGAFIGVIVGCLWWSVTVPRWREWAKVNGADEESTQQLAVRTLLVWPKGWFFEKTEFHTRKGT
jgi:hypothetical protein